MGKNGCSCSIGIEDSKRKAIAHDLMKFLADTYALYLKTQNYHWNVEGEHFRTLHLMFEEQYNDLVGAVDSVAERIRSLGERAPGGFAAFQKLTCISDAREKISAEEMVKDLLVGHEAVICAGRKLIKAAEEAHDVSTADMLTTRLESHEKTAWMLRATVS
ncbi:DNA starvation/stationary phase protection protein [Phaeovibrio sulfidiphilus]|uniref:DNA starvation/stationary phase protection protein n=1 Tax=Phaeovibrio sulfidiphilus TaxID=1220600 RepID=A0A8J7CS26_9PROT|nr:Dps family protein [Phaeovibrio sulfidiphilus]MBE1237950.1 DNA starvation/stationary phase protection protein [Phaeovibrio sulfidiphilus]